MVILCIEGGSLLWLDADQGSAARINADRKKEV